MVVVTTEGLFKIWLREHRKWWRDNNVPQDPAKALRHTSFYTQAMSTDAAVFEIRRTADQKARGGKPRLRHARHAARRMSARGRPKT